MDLWVTFEIACVFVVLIGLDYLIDKYRISTIAYTTIKGIIIKRDNYLYLISSSPIYDAYISKGTTFILFYDSSKENYHLDKLYSDVTRAATLSQGMYEIAMVDMNCLPEYMRYKHTTFVMYFKSVAIRTFEPYSYARQNYQDVLDWLKRMQEEAPLDTADYPKAFIYFFLQFVSAYSIVVICAHNLLLGILIYCICTAIINVAIV